VQASHSIVGNEWIGAPDQSQMMAQILGGFGQVHWRQLVTGGNPLTRGGEDT
jgi:hypothetical protein